MIFLHETVSNEHRTFVRASCFIPSVACSELNDCEIISFNENHDLQQIEVIMMMIFRFEYISGTVATNQTDRLFVHSFVRPLNKTWQRLCAFDFFGERNNCTVSNSNINKCTWDSQKGFHRTWPEVEMVC